MNIALIALIAVLGTAHYADGHATMVSPTNWFDQKQWLQTEEGVKFDFIGMKSGLQCFAGCLIPSDGLCPNSPSGKCNSQGAGCSCLWFSNYTHIEKPTLFDQKLRTYPHVQHPSYFLSMPWRAPGFAPIDSPCGVSGGNIRGCNGADVCPGGGYPGGVRAENYEFKYARQVTNWTRGSIVEAAWAITANHGGGYSYRLCKVPEQGVTGITEECFQRTPLQFYGSKQWIQFGEDTTTRQSFDAVRTSEGTFPEGSQWTKNPVPACNGGDGGFRAPSPGCLNGTQFPPPLPGIFGFGVNLPNPSVNRFKFSIIDKLVIPKSLEPGNYILSFRWDCEQTPQVWNTCASILLE